MRSRFGLLLGARLRWAVGLLWRLVCAVSLFFTTYSSASLLTLTSAANQLALNDIAPSHETLGALNGIVLSLSSGLRAVVPVAFNSMYAAGVKHRILGGQLAWLVMFLFALPFYFVLRYLPEKAEGRPVKKRPVDRA